MNIIADYHHATEAVLILTGLTDKEAHLNVGLIIYVGVQCLRRTRRASLDALATVAACEGLNELLDFLFCGDPHWKDTLGDIVATLAWPVILFVVSRYRRRRWAIEEGAKRSSQRSQPRSSRRRIVPTPA